MFKQTRIIIVGRARVILDISCIVLTHHYTITHGLWYFVLISLHKSPLFQEP